MNFDQSRRIRIISGIFALIAAVIIVRLYHLQIISADKYRSFAERQYVVNESGVFDRGDIYFETKDGELLSAATLKSGFTVTAKKQDIQDIEFVSSALSKFGSHKDDLIKKLSNGSGRYVELLKRINEKDAKEIKELKIPGIEVSKSKWRYYPGGTLASHVVGFVGFEENDYNGRYGLERYYNDALARDYSKSAYKNFFADLFSGIKKAASTGAIEADIVTTIDPNIQLNFEKELSLVHNEYSSDGTGGIIMDPKTGEILAMAYVPNFDPNFYNEEETSKVFTNPLVENVYEMGSIIKPLTMAAGLDSGAVTATTKYDDKGFVYVDDRRINNFDGKGRGNVSMQEVLNKSLNTGVVYVQQKMGRDNFVRYFKSYGIGEETGIDLPGEVHGLIQNLDDGRDVEAATASFGQGIALTPIATVRALSSLANGGYLVSPHVVKTYKYEIGAKKNVRVDEKKSVLSKAASDEITRLLVNVYDNALLEGKVKIERYSIAAKTGTAQIAKVGEKGYFEDRYLHSFFGYFPAYDAKFIIFLYTIYPKGVRYASETLTMPFVKIAKFMINYYELPPDR
jgi:cell division protein FtsI/penicillin-binding protein 2